MTNSLLNIAQQRILETIKPGDVTIDATLGNGHDTEFLARSVGELGLVYGFDIQAQAIRQTESRLIQNGLNKQAKLFLASHHQMREYIPNTEHGRVKAVMFNLGYLPGGDKAVITQIDSTLTALAVACDLMADNALMSILAYPGHRGGDSELAAVAEWCSDSQARSGFVIEHLLSAFHHPKAPQLFLIRKQAFLL